MGTNLFMILYALSLAIFCSFGLSKFDSLSRGSSLSVEKPGDVFNLTRWCFLGRFFPVGVNAYCFAVWFNEASPKDDGTVVWMANRDKPVNGKGSKLTLPEAGGLMLTDAGRATVSSTGPFSLKPAQLHLNDSGNVVLLALDGFVLWQSFDSPTDTTVTCQPSTQKVKLVSLRSQSNFSSGFHELFFDGYDILHLNYENNALSSDYWPSKWDMPCDVGRVAYNHSTFAWLDPLGYLDSSDNLKFMLEDYGPSLIQRRLKLDYDGNIRLNSRKSLGDSWVVSWQAFGNPCKIHGICGRNSLCTYDRSIGRQCSCLPGHKMTNRDDWSYGCDLDFNLSCNESESRFLKLSNTKC